MSIETRLANVAAGSVYVNIETSGSAIFTDLLDMGSIRYDFDLKGTEDTATLGAITGALTIQVDDRMSNGGSVYDVLDTIIGNYGSTTNLFVAPIANVTLYYDDKTTPGTYTSFPFDLLFSGVRTDEATNVTRLELRPKALGVPAESSAIAGNVNSNIFAWNGSAINITNKAAAGDYIQTALGLLDPRATTTIFETGSAGPYIPKIMQKKEDVPIAAELNAGLFVVPDGFTGFSAGAVLSKLASLEGAIYGGGFGTSFYTPRSVNSYNVQLSEDDVTELAFEKIYTGVANINASISNSAETFRFPSPGAQFFHALSNANLLTTAWEYGSQEIRVRWTGTPSDLRIVPIQSLRELQLVGLGKYDTLRSLNTNAITEATKSTTNSLNSQFLTQNILNTATQEYLLAQGVNRLSNGDLKPTLRISTEIIGVKTIKPYQVFTFDSSVPARYQNKHFRPSSLEYDLKADTVRVTAYEIP